MCSYTYSKLPSASSTTRMVRLLPHKQADAPIQCDLFNYALFDTRVERHLYEALSYVWHIDVESRYSNSQSILLNGCPFPVTKNLHAALFHLRDQQLERILWVDAICINQNDIDEKSQQIPLMRAIYAQASCVLVWLGEAMEDGDKAIQSIRRLSEGKFLKASPSSAQELNIDHDACLQLLQRNWFRRIWVRKQTAFYTDITDALEQVLEEVGVARRILIMCGSAQINGHVFCEGLARLDIPPSLLKLVRPVTQLISDANFRPEYEPGSKGAFLLGELIDMYHLHGASNPHDKVYALLGLSSDDPSTGALRPNYELPWNEVFKQTIIYIFSGESSVYTWPGRESAVISGKGSILGHVDSAPDVIGDYGRQLVTVRFNSTAKTLGYENIWGAEWILQASAVSIQKGDILCCLQGTSAPSIIRICRDHFIIIKAMSIPQKIREKESLDTKLLQESNLKEASIYDILLTWDISLGNSEPMHEPQIPTELESRVPEYREEPQERQRRLRDSMAPIMEDIAKGILEAGCSKHQEIEHLLYESGAETPITEGLVKAAAGFTDHGHKIIGLLLQHQEKPLPVSEEVMKAAAGNINGHEILELLFQNQGNALPVSEEVVKVAAANVNGYQIMKVLFRYQEDTSLISEEVVEIAAENTGCSRYELLELLF